MNMQSDLAHYADAILDPHDADLLMDEWMLDDGDDRDATAELGSARAAWAGSNGSED